VLAGTVPDAPPVVNVGGGQEATMREVIALVESFAGCPVAIDAQGHQRGDVRRTVADTAVARTSLGWRPTVPLDEGLRREFDWVAARRDTHSLELVAS
jgi:nucleoside-diphosphate-sugar epimerase